MAAARSSGDRAAHFPAIERKHGLPMAHWHAVMAELAGRTYAEQVAFLREEHGFSQAHANALVMYSRGSHSSRRYADVDGYLAEFPPQAQATVRAILDAIGSSYPDLDLVMAWNKPMLRHGSQYVFGLAVVTDHILLAPFDARVLQEMAPRLAGYVVLRKTVRVPLDWQVDADLLHEMVRRAIR